MFFLLEIASKFYHSYSEAYTFIIDVLSEIIYYAKLSSESTPISQLLTNLPFPPNLQREVFAPPPQTPLGAC